MSPSRRGRILPSRRELPERLKESEARIAELEEIIMEDGRPEAIARLVKDGVP